MAYIQILLDPKAFALQPGKRFTTDPPEPSVSPTAAQGRNPTGEVSFPLATVSLIRGPVFTTGRTRQTFPPAMRATDPADGAFLDIKVGQETKHQFPVFWGRPESWLPSPPSSSPPFFSHCLRFLCHDLVPHQSLLVSNTIMLKTPVTTQDQLLTVDGAGMTSMLPPELRHRLP